MTERMGRRSDQWEVKVSGEEDRARADERSLKKARELEKLI